MPFQQISFYGNNNGNSISFEYIYNVNNVENLPPQMDVLHSLDTLRR